MGAGQVSCHLTRQTCLLAPCEDPRREIAFVCDTDNGDSYYRLSVCYCIPSIRTCTFFSELRMHLITIGVLESTK